jgi:hypothetical protein
MGIGCVTVFETLRCGGAPSVEIVRVAQPCLPFKRCAVRSLSRRNEGDPR